MFKTYGMGEKGLKAEDLEQYEEMIKSFGMKIPEGAVILTGVFFQITEALKLENEDSPDKLRSALCPEFLLEINKDILGWMKINTPYAIRSSALSERGGMGIYTTAFFVPKGDKEKNLESLWGKEKEVYGSEFTADARAWREKNKAPIGMAILIQPVQGFHFGDYFLPALSGVAYTSYNGLPTVRVVIGLGTSAVEGGGVVYNTPPDHPLRFQRDIWELEAEVINVQTGRVEKIDSRYEEIHRAINYEAFIELFKKVTELKKLEDWSLEWAITDKGIQVVQCAPYKDRLPGDMIIDIDKYFLLAKGSDVFNSGHASGKGIIYAKSRASDTASMLENLNKKMSGYLLVVPQEALSLIAGLGGMDAIRLGFQHFSNAGALVEKQYPHSFERQLQGRMIGIKLADHTKDKGASHFQQLCDRSDILFLGTEFDETTLLKLPGRMDYKGDISVWEAGWTALVDGIKKEGFVYLSKEAKDTGYSPNQICDWSMALRDVANSINGGSGDLAGSFYYVHCAIGNHDGPIGFDPFKLDESIIKERGWDGLSDDIRTVLANFRMVDVSDPEDFESYLRKVLEKIAQKSK